MFIKLLIMDTTGGWVMTFEEGNFYTLNGVVDIARCQSKRIKLLEQRIIDLQGHDDLSYIDKKLSEQEGE